LADLSFSSAPDRDSEYRVGDLVEVMCDHDNDEGDRTRGWLEGVVVQVDPKIVAVQFEENVYLTDGWMVPDRILWYPINSKHLRPMPGKKAKKKEKEIPDY